MADINMDEFFSSGMMDDFFREMMEESGMAAEMMGNGESMEELQASFESFFKASMGMGDGPVMMPGGFTIDASEVPTMAEMSALGFGGEDEDDMSPEEMAAMMKMMGGGRGGDAPHPERLQRVGCVQGRRARQSHARLPQVERPLPVCQPASQPACRPTRADTLRARREHRIRGAADAGRRARQEEEGEGDAGRPRRRR